MEFISILRILLLHKRMIILLSLSALINGVIITYTLSNKFESTTVILVKPKQEVTLSNNTPQRKLLDFPLGHNLSNEAPTITIKEFIKSPAIAKQIVLNLKLDQMKRMPSDNYWKELWESTKNEVKVFIAKTIDILKFGQIYQSDPYVELVKEVQKNISVSQTEYSYLIELTVVWKHPKLAADIANEGARVFVDLLKNFTEVESRISREFIEKQLNETNIELNEARQTLKLFKENNKIMLFNEETIEKIKIISELESKLEGTNIDLQGILQQYSSTHPEVLQLRAKKIRLEESLFKRKRALEALPVKEFQLANLELHIKALESTYELKNKEYEQAKIGEAKTISNIKIISEAYIPSRPIKPIKVFYGGMSFLTALVIGLGAALFMESVHKTLNNVNEVETALETSVLATIPKSRIQ